MKKKYNGRGRKKRDEEHYKAPGHRSICAKALMRLRPERWSSTSSERRLATTLQIPADNLPLILTRVLSLSVRHYPLFGRKESVAACRHPCHPSPSPNSNQKLTIQRAYQYLRPKRADHVLSKNFILPFCTHSSGFVTLAIPGLSCWAVVVSVSRSERVASMRIRPLTVLQRRPCLEDGRKEIRDTG